MALHPLDYVAFCVFTSSSLALGLYYSVGKSNVRIRTSDQNSLTSATQGMQQEEVFLGSRSLPGWSLAVSLLATVASGVGVVSLSAHQYAYGFHFAWHVAAMAMTAPCIVCFFLPVLYRLKVTSVFQYLRMRFGNGVGITACIIYFVFSQTLGAVSIYSAAVGMSTILGIPLLACNVLIGALGTVYTTLGGLRGVVWADCVQGFVLFAAPFVIIAKIAYDSARLDVPIRPLGDISSEYYFRLHPDATSDETVWANAIASVPFHLVREGMDQMVAQRFLAARSFRTARRVVLAGTAMVAFFILTITLTGLALTYWYRDCDPMLTGAITRYDQIVPLYVAQHLSSVMGLRGLFLAGLVGASISTVSSVINSHAATFYVDIISPHFRLVENQAIRVTHLLEFGSGALMTAFAVAVPYVGTATRVLMALYSGASGPFAGMIAAAICLPWANTKGTAVATSAVFVFELWQTVGRTLSGLEPPRMNTTTFRCEQHVTEVSATLDALRTPRKPGAAANHTYFEREMAPDNEIFMLYRLSSYWSSFLAMVVTVSLSLMLSLLLADGKRELDRSQRLTSPTFLRLWTRLGLLNEQLQEPINEADMKLMVDSDQEGLPPILHLSDSPLSPDSCNSDKSGIS